jgi:hypothetical protein
VCPLEGRGTPTVSSERTHRAGLEGRLTIVSDPRDLKWQFSEVPAIEDVPPDAFIMVWDVNGSIGLLYPWGNDLNPTRWEGSGHSGCVDGCWSERRGEPKPASDGYGMILRENGVNLVQYRTVRKPVWWAWVKRGTEGLSHKHPTWREVHGPLQERDWE